MSNPFRYIDRFGLEPTLADIQEEMRRNNERGYQYVEYMEKELMKDIVYPESGYSGWEIHFIVGYGHVYSYSCTNGRKVRSTYKKWCYGAAVDVSLSVGGEFKLPGSESGKLPKELVVAERGTTLYGPFGWEGGAGVDLDGGGGGASLGGGVGVAIPGSIKSTTCKYTWIGDEDLGCCSGN